jgi:hypothetical protein
MSVEASAAQQSWTCARCEVTTRWAADSGHAEPPAAWIEEGGHVYCLACRRERAGEEGLRAAPADTPREQRPRIRTWALIEFEIQRDPERSNGEIARAVRSSIPAVAKARRIFAERSSS